MKLFIKNMKGNNSVNWLKTILDELCIEHDGISPGEVVLTMNTPGDAITALKHRLEEKGMEIIFDRKNILAEKVKHLVYEMLKDEDAQKLNYSTFIATKLFLNYTYIANIFSETQGITIEHFIISQKIEKVKRLLENTDHNISEIADMLNYSSIGHLSNQFKKVTGQTPTDYKKEQQKKVVESQQSPVNPANLDM